MSDPVRQAPTPGPVLLSCPTPLYEALVAATHRAKKGTRNVSVPLAALEALIVDHGRLLRAVEHKEPEL